MTLTSVQPITSEARNLRWAVSDGSYRRSHFFASASSAAAWVADESMRSHLAGHPVELIVTLRDRLVGVVWDATSNVSDVLTATNWPNCDGDTLQQRAAVIGIIRDILVSDETPVDAPLPGISDPHTYALVCR